MAIYGNTVLLKATFTNIDDEVVDPTEIELNIYNEHKRKIDSVSVGAEYKASTGVYQYPYVLPDGDGDFFYEFKAIISGVTVLNRAKIEKTWTTE